MDSRLRGNDGKTGLLKTVTHHASHPIIKKAEQETREQHKNTNS